MNFRDPRDPNPILRMPFELASDRLRKKEKTMKTIRGILLLAVTALTSAAAFGAPAGSEWTGTVASIAGDDLSLVGIPVHFRVAGSVTVAVSGRAVRTSDLAAGSAVTISASDREADGRLRATAVRVRSKNPFDLSGTVSRVSDDRTHVEVEGVSISLDDRTAFSGRNSSGASVRSAADLRAGMTVRVSLTSSSAGDLRGVSLAATEPEPEPVEDQEIQGTVDSVSDGLWKIAGRAFVIDANTMFVGAPGVGDFVEVRFHSDGQGNDVADRIAREDANEEFELRGVVEAIGDASWTISGQVILVNSSTQIIGSPAMGDTVEAEGVKAQDGTLTATKIRKEDPEDGGGGRNADPPGDDNGGNSGGNDDPPGDDNGGNSGGASGSGSSGGHHGQGTDDPAGDD
jgi:hypothetical protein